MLRIRKGGPPLFHFCVSVTVLSLSRHAYGSQEIKADAKEVALQFKGGRQAQTGSSAQATKHTGEPARRLFLSPHAGLRRGQPQL